MSQHNIRHAATTTAFGLSVAIGLLLQAMPAAANYAAEGLRVTIDDRGEGAPIVTFTQPPPVIPPNTFFFVSDSALTTSNEKADWSGQAFNQEFGPPIASFPFFPTLILTEDGQPSDILSTNVSGQFVCPPGVCAPFPVVVTPFDSHFISDDVQGFQSALDTALAGPHFFLEETGRFQTIPNADFGSYWGPILTGDPVEIVIRSDRAIPEPGTLALVGGALLGVFAQRRKRN